MKILFLGPRCPAITHYLSEKGHKIFLFEDRLESMDMREFDFGISYRYRHLIGKEAISAFKGRLINIHISYLPWNRGSDPNLWSFLSNTPSGVSLHYIDEGLDTGELLFQKKINHDLDRDTLRTTYTRVSKAAEDLFIEKADLILNSKAESFPQKGPGSFHRSADKLPYTHLWADRGWDTPIKDILGQAKIK